MPRNTVATEWRQYTVRIADSLPSVVNNHKLIAHIAHSGSHHGVVDGADCLVVDVGLQPIPLFHPMGGVFARPLDGTGLTAAAQPEAAWNNPQQGRDSTVLRPAACHDRFDLKSAALAPSGPPGGGPGGAPGPPGTIPAPGGGAGSAGVSTRVSSTTFPVTSRVWTLPNISNATVKRKVFPVISPSTIGKSPNGSP